MQFTFHKDAGKETLVVEEELNKYLFKVRRHKSDEKLFFRNLIDNNIYEYQIQDIHRKRTTLLLINSEERIIEPENKLHIGWCIIDPKSIEKVIAGLNEIGVSKITFIQCQYSQKQYKINFDKLEKLLINSSQQCGRSSIIKIESSNSMDEFIDKYPDTFMFNFSSNHVQTYANSIKTILIGCEGGYSSDEISKIKSDKIVGINSNLILRSETAIVSVASKILL